MPQLVASFDEMLNQALVTYKGNSGWILRVRAPSLNIDIYNKAGRNSDSDASLNPLATFRIASVTKTFVAAATLRLVEEGKLSVDATVSDVVPAPFPQILKDGGYDSTLITVRHLLTHTSGLYDYATDDDYAAAVGNNPSHIWTREEQVRFAMDHGRPIGAPGGQQVYSDTGYLLLGAILEVKTGQNLGVALRSLLDYDALGLTTTWFERFESAPAAAPVRLPQRYGSLLLADIDPSMDLFGGGGLISTTTDLEQFYRSLLNGKVFHSATTLDLMTTVPTVGQKTNGAMGIYRAEIGGVLCWAHQGAWGLAAAYCPDLGLGVAIADIDAVTGAPGIRPLVEATVGIVTPCTSSVAP